MKKNTKIMLLLLAIFCTRLSYAATQINLPVTFEDPLVDYTVTDFGGNATVLGADPMNAANTVAISTKDVTAQLWAGTTIGTNNGFSAAIPFTATNRKMTIRVYSPDANIPVRLKAEVHGQPTQSVETEAMTTIANGWEILTFDFDNEASGTAAFNAAYAYDMATIFFNFGTDGATAGTKTYYFDDVEFAGVTGPAQINLPVTFDASNVDYTVTDFGGNATVLGADPMNAANMVAITTKDGTAQTWAGTTIGTNNGFASVIPFTLTNRKMTVRVYSPDANIPVRLKAEVHGQPGQSVETEAMTTVANAWETLTFDFDNEASGTAAFNAAYTYDMATIFFNFGTDGATAGTKTYYFDDVEFAAVTGPAQIDLPVTFDAANVDYTLTDFGGNATVLGADPMNAANMVAISTKGNTAQLWAGTTIGTNNGFASVIPFTATNRKMTVRVYSPDANIPLRLKAEVHGQPGQSVETEAMTTVANAWETLTFDFDNEASGTAAFNAAYAYDMATIFFNFGTDGATAGTKTYYFDDVEFAAVTGPAQIDLPVTFDAANVDYTVTDFGGNATVLGADPMNAANMVAITTKDGTAQTWAGTTIGTNNGFASVIPFTATNRKMTVRVYSPDANIPVRLKAEVHGQGTQSVETEAMTTVANAWETLTFDFDNEASGTAAFNAAYAYDMATIFFNFGTDGATAGTKTYYFDDVEFAAVTGPAQIDLPVTFDAANVDYTVTDFGGNATVLGADPMNAANMVAITTKDGTAQTWAGTTIGTNNGFASVVPFTLTNRKMTVRVYSPDANIPVRLKAEVHGQPGQSVETEAMTTVANAWETLTFDFDNEASGTAAFNAAYAYDMATIFFNFGTDGATAGAKTYYFDDVEFAAVTGPAQIDLPVTFDAANVDYTVTDFGGNATVLGADPMNAANMVAISTKGNTAQLWAGTTIGTNNGFTSVIPFTATNRKMTIRVYSPDANIPVRLKAEVHGQPTQSVETEAMTTVANAWETLTFNFNNQASGTAPFNAAYAYDMATIFFNFGTDGATAGTKTYYFDDVEMGTIAPPSGISLPITFEDTTVNYVRTDFDGGATAVMANPFSGGINTSATVMQMIKNAGQVWAGSKMTLSTPLDFTTNNTFKMKVYSPRTGCPVLFKLEGAGATAVERTVFTSVANAWEELSWDFAGSASGMYTDLVFIYDLGTMGDGSANFTFYQDDIQFVTATSTLNQIDLTVTFDSTNVNYTLTDFGGNASVLGADPMNASNTVAITTKGAGAQVWAGTTVGTNLGFANVIPFTSTNRKMRVMVYSPDANIPVRLKVEVHGQPTQSVETEALTTAANTWEYLVFDFNNEASGTAAFNPAYAYDVASIFFNFGTDGATAGAKTYYWDNVEFYGSVAIAALPKESLKFYPNPVANNLTILLSEANTAQNAAFTISDISGRIVMNGNLNNNQIEVANLAKGIYSLCLITKQGMLNKTFVKQ